MNDPRDDGSYDTGSAMKGISGEAGTFRKTAAASMPADEALSERRHSRRIMVGPVPVGGGAPISVQSMTNTKTSDVNATLQQIAELAAAVLRNVPASPLMPFMALPVS